MIPDARLADDSDSQHAALERERVVVSRTSRPYWNAIPDGERERIVEAVPAGLRLHLYPGLQAHPGTTTVELRDHEGHLYGARLRGRLTASLCWSVLSPLSPRIVATIGPDGYVESIEETP